MAVWEELDPTIIPDPYNQAGPQVDHPAWPRIIQDLAAGQDDLGGEEGTHEGKTGLSLWVGAQSSRRAAGWKELCILLHGPLETRVL